MCFADWWWKMASRVFDASELEAYSRELVRVGQEAPKKQKQFMRREGNKLRRATKREAKRLGRKSGNYESSIKRGKAYHYQGAIATRVYSTAPHAHLIEEGHRMVTHDGREVGFVPGYHVFEVAGKRFEPEYLADIDDMLDEAVKNL